MNNSYNQSPFGDFGSTNSFAELPSSKTWEIIQSYSQLNTEPTEANIIRSGAQPPTRPNNLPIADAVVTIILLSCIYAISIARRINKKKII